MLKKDPSFDHAKRGKGPYDHFGLSVGGLSSNRSTSGRSQTDNMKEKGKLYLPDVLPIRLSYRRCYAAGCSGASDDPSPTVVSLPPAPSPAKSNTEKMHHDLYSFEGKCRYHRKKKGQIAQSVKEFLKQIPNLS
jgi:hypothetical protein